MFEVYKGIILDLWTKVEFQELEYSEIFGLIGIAVSSAALFLCLKVELVKGPKASDTLTKKVELEENDDDARSMSMAPRKPQSTAAETSSELVNLLSKIVSKSNQQSPLDEDLETAFVDHSSVCAALLRTQQQKKKEVINKSVSSNKNVQAEVKEASLSPTLQNLLRKVVTVPQGSHHVFNEDELKNIIFEIHQAAMMSYEEKYSQRCISLLLVCPAAVNAPRHPYGFTPFLSACWAGSLSLVRFMLQNGADVNDRTVDGDTPMYLAVRATLDTNQTHPNLALLHTLHDAGCKVNCSNRAGFSPLHLAATCGNADVTKWLLERGALTTPRTFNGYRALELARNEGHEHLVPLLEAAETKQRKTMRRKTSFRRKSITPDKVTSDSGSIVNSAEDSCCSDHEP